MPTLEKAIITNTINKIGTPVMFNPTDYTVAQDINYAKAAIPGLSQPLLQFVNGNVPTLEMELFLDTNEATQINGKTIAAAGSDVRALTQQITNLMIIDSTTHAPPVVVFTWASLSFTCVLARCAQKFVMFLGDGTPVRARLQVSFQGYNNSATESKELKLQTADYSKSYTVAQGDSLSKIAGIVYGNPQLWRPIGLSNGIDNSIDLTIGQQLLVPQLPYTDPETGEVVQ
jgi:Contractile injection system tube protein/LysM domain